MFKGSESRVRGGGDVGNYLNHVPFWVNCVAAPI